MYARIFVGSICASKVLPRNDFLLDVCKKTNKICYICSMYVIKFSLFVKENKNIF